MSLDDPEHVDNILTFLSGYDTLEYSWVKATAVSVRLRILFMTLQSTNNREWKLDFRRSLTQSKGTDLTNLRTILQPMHLLPIHDDVEWSLEKSRDFPTKSLYRFITQGVCVCEEL